MATVLKNLSDYDINSLPSAKGMKVGIVVAEWNSEITFAMCEGAKNLLIKNGADESDITIHPVPGSFELISGSKMVADNCNVDAVIALGTVIQGETRHFDFICEAVAVGLGNLNIKYNIPFIFGVLTTDNLQQAKDRSGGKHGNKGDEAAFTAIKMIALNKKLKVKS
jgi:6,7-dimethyl-8-ribityllumazine synthase